MSFTCCNKASTDPRGHGHELAYSFSFPTVFTGFLCLEFRWPVSIFLDSPLSCVRPDPFISSSLIPRLEKTSLHPLLPLLPFALLNSMPLLILACPYTLHVFFFFYLFLLLIHLYQPCLCLLFFSLCVCESCHTFAHPKLS